MSDSYIQLPADSTGKKMRTRQRVIGSNTVEEQYAVPASLPTYYAWIATQTVAQNKPMFAIHNDSASQVVYVRKLFAINGQITPIAGGMIWFDVLRIGTSSGGTAVVATATDTNDGELANVTIVSSPSTIQRWGTLFPWFTQCDEIGASSAFPTPMIQQLGNVLPEGAEVKELTLRQNQGLAVRHTISTTNGTWGFLVVLSVEAV